MKFKITLILFTLFFSVTIIHAKEKVFNSKNGIKKIHKNYVPITYEWDKSSKFITVNQPVTVTVKLKALKNFKNIIITASLHPALSLTSGNKETKFDVWEAGEIKTIQYSVIPLKADKYELAVHCSVIYEEERMGKIEAFEFASTDFNQQKQENLEKSGDQEYTVLPGKSD